MESGILIFDLGPLASVLFRVFCGQMSFLLSREVIMLYEELTYKIQGACFEVYKTMGSGFLEAVYQECLEMEFTERGIPFESQKELELEYKDKRLKQRYVPDFVCYGKIIIELKAVDKIASEHKAQMLNYLHASDMRLGLLVNFGHHPQLEYKRMII